MALSPLDIQQKTFRAALRGYAEDEVDDFLDEVVMTIRDYEQKISDAQEEAETLRGRIVERRDTEDTLSKALMAAQRAADQIMEEARREAERTLSDARADASRLSVEQGREKNQLIDELGRLREIVADVTSRLLDVSGDFTTRVTDVGSDIDDARLAYGRWDDSLEPPPQSAIEELREEEDATENGDRSDAGDGDKPASSEDRNENGDDTVDGPGEIAPDGSDSLDIRDVNDDAEDDYIGSSQTSSARRPWERYDD